MVLVASQSNAKLLRMQVPCSESHALVFLGLPSVFDSFASLVPFSFTSFPRKESLNLAFNVRFVSNANVYTSWISIETMQKSCVSIKIYTYII